MTKPLPSETRSRIESLVYEWLADTAAPGASLTIVDADGPLFETGFGARRLKTNEPATPETLYGFASVTKSFTALATLQCVDRDEIALDDPIAKHTDTAFDGAEEITVEELLSHRSGLPSLAMSTVLLARNAGMEDTGVPLADREDLSRFFEGAGALRDDLSAGRFMYNNAGYVLLSHAVESATGQPFEEYVDEWILSPLGMDRSTFDGARYDTFENRATPHRAGDDGLEETSFPARELSYGPGGLITSTSELGRYLRCNLAGGTLDGERLVSEELLERAHTTHVEPLPRYGDGYGYGWSIHDLAGTTLIGHGGSLLTSSAAVGFLPERGLGFALGCAAQPEVHPTEIGMGIAALLCDEEPREVVPAIAYRERVRQLTGEYEGYRGITTATVTDEGGSLSLALSVGPIEQTYTLVPEDPSLASFRFLSPEPGRSTPVEFVERGDGIDLFVDRHRLRRQ